MVSVVRVTVEAGSSDPVHVKLKESEHVIQPGAVSGAYSLESNDTLQVKVEKPKKEEVAPHVDTTTSETSEKNKPSTNYSGRHR